MVKLAWPFNPLDMMKVKANNVQTKLRLSLMDQKSLKVSSSDVVGQQKLNFGFWTLNIGIYPQHYA